MVKSIFHWGMWSNTWKYMKANIGRRLEREREWFYVWLYTKEYGQSKVKFKYYHKGYEKFLMWDITFINGPYGGFKIWTWIS